MSSTHLNQKTLQESAPISSESGDPLRTGIWIPEWIHEPEAAKLLAIKPSTLRNMRRERRLEINAAIDADKDRRDVSSKAHLTGYLLSNLLLTMTLLDDSVRFDLLVHPMKDQMIEG